MNEYYKIVGLTIACFVTGFMFWSEFFELSINEIKSSKIRKVETIDTGSYSPKCFPDFNGTSFREIQKGTKRITARCIVQEES